MRTFFAPGQPVFPFRFVSHVLVRIRTGVAVGRQFGAPTNPETSADPPTESPGHHQIWQPSLVDPSGSVLGKQLAILPTSFNE